jgi:hypothetical protein
MLITVKYRNGKLGLVEDSILDELIRSKKIVSFLRLEGWVVVGADIIRQTPISRSKKSYKGPNRRRHFKAGTEDLF